jgi:hypothetical protein
MRLDNKEIINRAIALLLAVGFLIALVLPSLPIYMVKGICALFMIKFIFETVD